MNTIALIAIAVIVAAVLTRNWDKISGLLGKKKAKEDSISNMSLQQYRKNKIERLVKKREEILYQIENSTKALKEELIRIEMEIEIAEGYR